MANLLNKIPTNLTEYPNSFKRQGAFPLEAYSIFYNTILELSGGGSIEKTALLMAQDYAKNNPIAYVGQVITTVEKDSKITLYLIIDEAGNLAKITSLNDLNEISNDLNSAIDDLDEALATLKGNTDTSLESLEEKHNKYEENINKQLASIGETITSKTHFSVQLISAARIIDNKIKLIDASEFTDAKYGVIYLLKDDKIIGEDVYKEYMLVQLVKSSGGPETYQLTLTGTTSTDLSDYAKTSDLELLLALQESINGINLSKDYIIAFNTTTGSEDEGKIELKELDLSPYAEKGALSDYTTKDSINTLFNLQTVIDNASKTKQYAIGYVKNTGTDDYNIQLQEISLDDGVWGEE